jgi:MoxR-like ATPase
MTVAPYAGGSIEVADGSGGGDTAARMRAIVAEVAEMFWERQHVARMLAVAMLARQHSLMLGPPGTAKSELARELTGRITGARMWEILLSKFTAPTAIFGPVDVAVLGREGRYTQIFDGRATQAEIAFIDEIFKCGSGALNAMLAYLNERLYHPENGGAPITCPLISAVCASNELPEGDDTGAIFDRLLVRLEVGYLRDPSNFAALLRSAVASGPPPTRTTVELADLSRAVALEVPRMPVQVGVIDAIGELRTALRREGIIASDRRWKASVGLVQASAWLAGRQAADVNDVAALAHVLWDSPTQRPTVERQVLQLVNPGAKEALEQADAIDQVEAQLESKAGQSDAALSDWGSKEAVPKLKKAGRKLAELRHDAVAAGRSTETIDRVIAQQRQVHARVLTEALGVSVSVASASVASGR